MPDPPDSENQKKSSETQNGEQRPPVTTNFPEPVPVREISQTDQLNKRLLTSLLERMNAGDENLQRMIIPDDPNAETWETDPGDDSSPT